jgi:hypothetical protein
VESDSLIIINANNMSTKYEDDRTMPSKVALLDFFTVPPASIRAQFRTSRTWYGAQLTMLYAASLIAYAAWQLSTNAARPDVVSMSILDVNTRSPAYVKLYLHPDVFDINATTFMSDDTDSPLHDNECMRTAKALGGQYVGDSALIPMCFFESYAFNGNLQQSPFSGLAILTTLRFSGPTLSCDTFSRLLANTAFHDLAPTTPILRLGESFIVTAAEIGNMYVGSFSEQCVGDSLARSSRTRGQLLYGRSPSVGIPLMDLRMRARITSSYLLNEPNVDVTRSASQTVSWMDIPDVWAARSVNMTDSINSPPLSVQCLDVAWDLDAIKFPTIPLPGYRDMTIGHCHGDDMITYQWCSRIVNPEHTIRNTNMWLATTVSMLPGSINTSAILPVGHPDCVVNVSNVNSVMWKHEPFSNGDSYGFGDVNHTLLADYCSDVCVAAAGPRPPVIFQDKSVWQCGAEYYPTQRYPSCINVTLPPGNIDCFGASAIPECQFYVADTYVRPARGCFRPVPTVTKEAFLQQPAPASRTIAFNRCVYRADGRRVVTLDDPGPLNIAFRVSTEDMIVVTYIRSGKLTFYELLGSFGGFASLMFSIAYCLKKYTFQFCSMRTQNQQHQEKRPAETVARDSPGACGTPPPTALLRVSRATVGRHEPDLQLSLSHARRTSSKPSSNTAGWNPMYNPTVV